MNRILQIVGAMNRGGIETFIMNVYRNIDRSKLQFDFLVHTSEECAYDEEIKELGGNIFSVIPRRQGIYKNKRSLEDFFKVHNDYSIAHQHLSSLTYVQPLRIAKNYGIPNRIVHGHNIRQGGSSLHKYIHGINQFLIETYATDYFACSEPSARWTFPKRILERKEYGVINNAIESERFKFNEQIRNKIRKELGIEDKFVIGHIGRFHPQKNHTYLIDIFKQIHIKSGESVLLLVGDGNLRPDIERRIQELGLTDSVIFTGIRKDVAEILQAMDIFLFPSLYEGLGIVLVEAQATGLKCFTSNKVVPESVNVTGLVEFIDLEKSPEHWAGEIFRKKDYQRKNTINDIKKSGYDITQVANEIQVWYESKINNTILLDNRKL